MTQFTTILDQESGIQFDGVRDSGEENNQPIHGLIVGKFRRGRFDRSMTITEKNIRGVLGHDSKNPYYRMVQDVLNSGVDSVQVLRVPGDYFDIKPAPIFGSWILNPGVSILNGVATYTGYKTNTIDTYDSHADLDLTAAIVRSLHDTDMQQWQAVKDACNELTNGAACTFDNVNEQIIYMSQQEYVETYPYIYKTEDSYVKPSTAYSAVNACKLYVSKFNTVFGSERSSIYSSTTENRCNFKWDWGTSCKTSGICNESGWMTISKTSNPSYNPNFVKPTIFVSFATVAAKIISNASSSNQGISLMAETYLENVANSIFNAESSKQFVKLTDLDPLFEANKVLRVL